MKTINYNKFLSEIFIIMEDYEQALNILNYISKNNNEHKIFYNLGYCYFKLIKLKIYQLLYSSYFTKYRRL